MGFTRPATKLSRERPPDRLMSLGIWLPVACQFLTCALFQVRWPKGAGRAGQGRAGGRLGPAATLRPCCSGTGAEAAPPCRSLPPLPRPVPARPQVLAMVMLSRQPFYTRFDPHPADGSTCFSAGTANSARCSQSAENSVAFLMALGQFLITAFVFNKGPPHRLPLYTNAGLLAGRGGRVAGHEA